MRGKATYIFATRTDLEPGLRSMEQQRPLVYARCGSYQSPMIQVLVSALEVPDLGYVKLGDQTPGRRYLAVNAGTEIKVRPVRQHDDRLLYFVDTEWNPTGVIFMPSGMFGDNCLLSGELVGVGDPRSLELYNIFRRNLLKGFTKIGMFHVGPEAVRLLDDGVRLTKSVQSPPACDLRRPAHTP